MFLVDTNVLSASSPSEANPAFGVLQWMERNSNRLFVSVITVAEIENGIAKADRSGASRKARLLSDWLDSLLHLYRERIVPLDLVVARVVGTLVHQTQA